ncbi:MAG: ATPase [Betaproteobacteria bacterium]|nr:ATPase [Betaproteobacteria bacterium]
MTRRTPSTAPPKGAGQAGRYRDRIFDDQRHDPYQTKGKVAGPLRCGDCGVVYANGRWQRGSAPEGIASGLCPACRRIRDKLPAGQVILEGPFVPAHREELLRIARNEAGHEESEHPLHRIMRIDERDEAVTIATTDIHLPQRIGEAVKRACRGELEVRYGSDEYSVRVHWRR